MIYWKKFNVAHFHIPKTGGNTTRIFLNKMFGMKGMLFRTKGKYYHEPLEKKMYLLYLNSLDPLIITNVRNPFEYLISLYYHSRRGITNDNFMREVFFTLERARYVLKCNFHEFVEWYVEHGFSFRQYLDNEGNIPDKVRINKLETLKEDLEKMFKEINVNFRPKELGHENSRSRGAYICEYTPELRDKVRKKFKWTFDNFYPGV